MQRQKNRAYLQKLAVVMVPDEKKALAALMQQIRALRLWGRRRRRAKSGGRDIRGWRRRRRMRRKEVIRIAGWKNEREDDMEDGWGYRSFKRWLYGSFSFFLFHTITTTVVCTIVYIRANVRSLWVIIAIVGAWTRMHHESVFRSTWSSRNFPDRQRISSSCRQSFNSANNRIFIVSSF